MPIGLGEILARVRTSGVRLLLIAAASILLVRLPASLVNRVLRLMADGRGATITEAEKRARTMASLLWTVGTSFIVVVAAPGESQVTLRLLLKTVPSKQWDVARELRRRIRLPSGVSGPWPSADLPLSACRHRYEEKARTGPRF